jgi:hypothetical protein
MRKIKVKANDERFDIRVFLIFGMILLMLPIVKAIPTTYYVYTCVDPYSLETITSYNETTAIVVNSVKCPFGCSENNTLNYHQGAIPQADLCNSDPFYSFLIVVAVFVALIVIAIYLVKHS